MKEGQPDGELLRACERGDLNGIRSVIKNDKDSITINYPNTEGKTPLHIATEKLRPDIIKILLKAKANPNLRDDDGNTPLHYLVQKSFCVENSKDSKYYDSLEYLIDQRDVDLTAINFKGETALNNLQASISELTNTIGLPEKLSELFEKIEKKKSKKPAEIVLEARVYNWIAGKNIEEFIDYYERSLVTSEEEKEKEVLIDGLIGSKSILSRVVSYGNKSHVEFLLKTLNADPLVKDVDDEIPLNAALSLKNAALSQKNSELSLKNAADITELLIEKMKEREKDPLKNLDEVKNSSDEVKSFLIAKGAYIGNVDGTVNDCITANVLKMVINNSINSYDCSTECSKKVPEDPNHCVVLNYDFLFSKSEEKSLKRAIPLLLSMANKSEVKEAFKHPLIEIFVLLRFSMMSKKLFIWDLLPYVIIAVLITLSAIIRMKYIYVTISLMIFLIILFTIKECIVALTQRREYFKTFDSWIKLLTNLAVVGLVFHLIHNPMDEELQIKRGFCHHLAWIMLGSTFVIFILFGEIPLFAHKVAIVKKITWNYFKALLPLSIIYLGFNYCFMIIFAHIQPNITNDTAKSNETGIHNYFPFFETIPKTLVMSSGEFDYSTYSEASEGEPWYIELSANLILLLFVFFIFLVLTNVFTVIAVGDVELLKQNLNHSLHTSMLKNIYFQEAYIKKLPDSFQRWLLSFNESEDIAKIHVKINMLSKKDGYIHFEKEENVVSLEYLIENRTKAALRDIYRKKIGLDREIPAKDEIMELMVKKMEEFESQQKENQENLKTQLRDSTAKLESNLKENQIKLAKRLTGISKNRRRMNFELIRLIKKLRKRKD